MHDSSSDKPLEMLNKAEQLVVHLLECASSAVEELAKEEPNLQIFNELTRNYITTIKSIQVLLRGVLPQLSENITLQNSSYRGRRELEIEFMKTRLLQLQIQDARKLLLEKSSQ